MKLLVICDNMTRKIFITVFSLFFVMFFTTPQALSQNCGEIWSIKNIHTIQAYKKGWPLSPPIIQLGTSERLIVAFDELSLDVRNLSYTFTHYDAQWKKSDLLEIDYIKGYNLFYANDYQYSFNTNFNYIHYQIEIPSDEVKLLKSGNYTVNFFDVSKPEFPLLTVPFYVYEPLTTISARVKYTSSASYSMSQEVDFKVQHPGLVISSPQTEVKVMVRQNGRNDNIIKEIKPVFVRHNELVYTDAFKNIFEGGNEFRWLDIRSTRFWPQQIATVEFLDPYYHFVLNADNWGDEMTYLYREDFNGRYVIEKKEGRTPETDADYVFVHFTLPASQSLADGDIHIMGALNNWKLDDTSKMKYNTTTGCYEATLLLKQGFYNYQYAFLPRNQQKATVAPMENSFAQTENDYTILVYYRGFSDRYDRLVGASIINSLKNNPVSSF